MGDLISWCGSNIKLPSLKPCPPPTPKWKLNDTYYIQPYSWSLEEGGILAGQLQPGSVDQEGIRGSLMAAADLEPAERDRANQREAVLVFHASHPPYIMIKENHIFSSKYWQRGSPEPLARGHTCELPCIGDLGVGRCCQIQPLAWRTFSLNDILHSDENITALHGKTSYYTNAMV